MKKITAAIAIASLLMTTGASARGGGGHSTGAFGHATGGGWNGLSLGGGSHATTGHVAATHAFTPTPSPVTTFGRSLGHPFAVHVPRTRIKATHTKTTVLGL